MMGMVTHRRHLLAWTLALGTLVAACSERGGDDLGTLAIALEGDVASTEKWFRVQLFDGPIADGEVLFDSSCLAVERSSFEINYLPVGEGRSLLVEYFTGAECRDDAKGSIGFRGGITIASDAEAQPFYYVQRYPRAAVVALPEDLNVSGGNAFNLSEDCGADCLCETDADCEPHVAFGGLCYHETLAAGGVVDWCIPTCVNDSQCQELHPNAVCDAGSPYCIIHSPFPLNLSEARAFGHAVGTPGGDVIFAGGFGEVASGVLRAVSKPFERFDADSGLFAAFDPGVPAAGRGLAGFTALGEERFALVGGVLSVRPVWAGQGAGRTLTFEGLGGQECSGGTCGPNMSDDVVVVDSATDAVTVAKMPGPRAQPTLLALHDGAFLVIGGYMASGISDGAVRSSAIWRCEVDAALAVTCGGFGTMMTERAGAGAMCVGEACDSVLVIGGNTGGQLAELLDVSGSVAQTSAVANPSLPGKIFQPRLCGGALVAGGDGLANVGGIFPASVEVNDDGVLLVDALTNVSGAEAPILAAVIDTPDGCWVAGGVDGGGAASAGMYVAAGGTFAQQGVALHRARYAAAVAPIRGGPLDGSLMFGGGLRFDASGASAEVVRGVEVFRP